MSSQGRILKSRRAYQGQILEVRVDQVVEPGGIHAWRELVVHRGSVVVLPVLADGRVLLIRQYRHAARRSLWELVAGSIEPGETSVRAAQRELLEETGYQANHLEHLLSFYSSPGFLTEEMHLIQASGLTKSRAHPEADERIRVHLFTRDEIGRMLFAKQIRDAKTFVGILWHLRQPKARHAPSGEAK